MIQLSITNRTIYAITATVPISKTLIHGSSFSFHPGRTSADESAIVGSMDFAVDVNDPERFALVLSTAHITLLNLLSVFAPPIFIAWQTLQATVPTVTRALNAVIDIDFENVDIHIVPVDTEILGESYSAGTHASGRVSFWGWGAYMYVTLSESEVIAYGEMDAFRLPVGGDFAVFEIAGAGDEVNPVMSLAMLRDESMIPEFYISGAITILGITTEVLMQSVENGVEFAIERDVPPIANMKLEGLLGLDHIILRGSMDFRLNLTISLLFGDIPLVDHGFEARINAIEVSPTQFVLDIGGYLFFMGEEVGKDSFFRLDYSLEDAITSIADLLVLIGEYLQELAEEIFGAMFDALADIGRAIADGVIVLAGTIADAARMIGATVEEFINTCKQLGEGVAVIASGLNDVYNMAGEAIVEQLQVLGHTVDEIGGALHDGAGYAAEAIAGVLKHMDYVIDEIASALKYAGYTAEVVASTLYDVGYEAYQVAQTMQAVFNMAGDDIEELFDNIGGDLANLGNDTWNTIRGALGF